VAFRDPRDYQMIGLSSLLIYGIGWLNFEINVLSCLTIITSALLTQYYCTRFFLPSSLDIKSPLISSLSLCLLLRSNSLWLMSLTAVIAILSKFILRWRGKHIFNPTNFGLVAMMLLTNHIWVSPGQWGSTAVFAFFLIGLGSLVIYHASRTDLSLAFLLFYSMILFGRAAWLGDPWQIPWHQLQNGGLLLFAFFMISDPKTTPDSRAGRILFALLVALGAGIVHFVLFRNNGLLWSLAFCSLFVPVFEPRFDNFLQVVKSKIVKSNAIPHWRVKMKK